MRSFRNGINYFLFLLQAPTPALRPSSCPTPPPPSGPGKGRTRSSLASQRGTRRQSLGKIICRKMLVKNVCFFYKMEIKKTCIVRESNPGRPRGRRAFYHWTNDVSMSFCNIHIGILVVFRLYVRNRQIRMVNSISKSHPGLFLVEKKAS